MKLQVAHWMGQEPPHPKAEKEDGKWWLTIPNPLTLVDGHDVMLLKGKNGVILWLDQHGGSFRQR